MELDQDDLRADSPDFTQTEADTAICVSTVQDMIANLRAQVCEECGSRVFPTRHEQRRRSKAMYFRMKLTCGNMHEAPIVFRVASAQPVADESP